MFKEVIYVGFFVFTLNLGLTAISKKLVKLSHDKQIENFFDEQSPEKDNKIAELSERIKNIEESSKRTEGQNSQMAESIEEIKLEISGNKNLNTKTPKYKKSNLRKGAVKLGLNKSPEFEVESIEDLKW